MCAFAAELMPARGDLGNGSIVTPGRVKNRSDRGTGLRSYTSERDFPSPCPSNTSSSAAGRRSGIADRDLVRRSMAVRAAIGRSWRNPVDGAMAGTDRVPHLLHERRTS